MSEKKKPSLFDLKPEVDPVLAVWYQQEAEGLPEDERIALTPKQQQHVAMDKKLEEGAARLEEETKHLKKGPAVSMSDLEDAQ